MGPVEHKQINKYMHYESYRKWRKRERRGEESLFKDIKAENVPNLR